MPEFITLYRGCLKARMASDFLSNFNFWGWQLIIVAAAITLPLGYTTSKEYAELEWPIDIAIALGLGCIWCKYDLDNLKKKTKTFICGCLVLFSNFCYSCSFTYL